MSSLAQPSDYFLQAGSAEPELVVISAIGRLQSHGLKGKFFAFEGGQNLNEQFTTQVGKYLEEVRSTHDIDLRRMVVRIRAQILNVSDKFDLSSVQFYAWDKGSSESIYLGNEPLLPPHELEPAAFLVMRTLDSNSPVTLVGFRPNLHTNTFSALGSNVKIANFRRSDDFYVSDPDLETVSFGAAPMSVNPGSLLSVASRLNTFDLRDRDFPFPVREIKGQNQEVNVGTTILERRFLSAA